MVARVSGRLAGSGPCLDLARIAAAGAWRRRGAERLDHQHARSLSSSRTR